MIYVLLALIDKFPCWSFLGSACISSCHHSEITVPLGLTLRGPELSLQITSHHEAIRVATSGSADTLKYLGAYLPPQFLWIFKFWPLCNPCFCASFAIHLKWWGLFICFFYTLISILISFLGRLFGVFCLRYHQRWKPQIPFYMTYTLTYVNT